MESARKAEAREEEQQLLLKSDDMTYHRAKLKGREGEVIAEAEVAT